VRVAIACVVCVVGPRPRAEYAALVRLKLAAAAPLVAAALAATSAGAAAPPSGICRTLVQGPTVTMTWTGRETTSHRYYAAVARYDCTPATNFMRRIIIRRSPGLQERISGPRGFACISLAPRGYTVFQGACKSKKRPQIGFDWALAFH
jgi:hypothetical protein